MLRLALATLALAIGPPLALAQDPLPATGPDTTVEVAAPKRAPKTGRATKLERAIVARERRKVTDKYDDTFRKYSKRYFGPNFDWRTFKAQSMAESDLNPNARSYVGARGLMQLMPSTFQMIRTVRPEFTSIDDPEFNIAAGIMHDRYLWTLWKGHTDIERRHFMFASYNAGQGTIGRAKTTARGRKLDDTRWPSIEQIAPDVQRWRYRETLGYVRKIRSNYDSLRTTR